MGSQGKWPVSAPPPGVQRWSTEAVPDHLKLDYWAAAICDVYLRADCSAPTAVGFDGAIESVVCSSVNFTRMESSSLEMRTHTSGGCKDVYYLVADHQACWTLRQNHRVQQVRPGDVGLIDARETYQVAFHEGMSVCAVELPVPWMREHLSLPDERRSAVIPRDAGWGRVLSALALELSKDLTLATQLPAPQLLDHLGGLLRGALEPDEPGGSRRSVLSLQDRAERVLAQRLAEPGLSAGDVAQALGVSVRTLHRVFAGSGSTFAATLRERRLQHAVSLLRRHNLGGVPVAEIGALCGFQDASHFSREFHRQWGAPPARWRLLQAN